MFRDREDAGQQLLERLSALELDNLVILALPRGGLPVADVIAEGLDASLDIVLVRKVGCPGHRELAVGAVTNGSDPLLTVNEEVALALGLDHERIRALAEPELETIRQRRQLYLKGRPSVPLAGKTVVVVDDGIATGATMRAALSRIRQAKPSPPVGRCAGGVAEGTGGPRARLRRHHLHRRASLVPSSWPALPGL